MISYVICVGFWHTIFQLFLGRTRVEVFLLVDPMARETRKSLVDDVYNNLGQRVLEMRGDNEQWLPTTADLSEEYRVSRTVMREAIKRLESQGLVESRHGKGVLVVNRLHKPVMASLSLLLPDQAERLWQAMAVRFLLEVEIARLAAEEMTETGLADMREAQERLLSSGGTLDVWVQADTDFHKVLAKSCGNEVLKLMLESIVGLGRESRKLTITHTGIERAHQGHERIIEAIERRDGEAAAQAMRDHLEDTRNDLAEQLSLHQDSTDE